MKKILSIALVVMMLLSCVSFTANAAADFGHGWQWLDDDAYGYTEETHVTTTNVIFEFDANVVEGAEGGAMFALWTEGGGNIEIDALNGSIKMGNNGAVGYAGWGTLDYLNWKHVAIKFDNGNAEVSIEGEVVATGSGFTPHTDRYLFFSHNGILTIDNWKISDLDGNVLFFDDFENAGNCIFRAGGGSQVELVSDPLYRPEPVIEDQWSKAVYVNAGYGDNLDYSIGSSQTWEFDLWLFDDDSGLQLWADTATTRYTFTKTYVGMNQAGAGGGYGADDYAGITWHENGTTFTTAGWHHFKLELNVDGQDRIYQDGNLVWTGSSTANAYWENGTCYNTIGNGVAVDNLTITGSNGNTYAWDFEDGSKGIFDEGAESVDVLVVKGNAESDAVISTAAWVTSDYFYKENVPAGAQTWEFDMWLFDEESGIQFWADTASTRYTIAYNYVGMNMAGSSGSSAYGDSDEYSSLTWNAAGAGFDVPGWHHFKVEMGVNGHDAIYQDGVLVWEGSTTANKYWDGCFILNVIGTGVAMDNVSINGSEPATFEDGNIGYFGEGGWTPVEVVVEGEAVLECPHLATEVRREVEPTCQTEGLDGIYCLNENCHVEGGRIGEEVVPTVDHVWSNNHMVDYKAATAEEDGYKVWACTYNCGTTTKATIPATGSYTGDLYCYFDMDEAVATQVIGGFFDAEGLVVENGVGIIPEGNDQSYHQFPEDARDNTQWSVTFDVNVTGIHDTNDTVGYGHKVYFWFGGQTGIGNEAGYDFEKGCFYIKPASGSTYDAIENYIDFPMNEWHRIKFEFNAPGEDAFYDNEENSYCAIYVDGEEVVKFSTSVDPWDDTALYELPTEQKLVIVRTFGVNAQVDNYVLGSADFAWVEEEEILRGDANGDGRINLADSRILRMALLDVITYDDIYFDGADVDGNGRLNTRDALLLKMIIAGEDING